MELLHRNDLPGIAEWQYKSLSKGIQNIWSELAKLNQRDEGSQKEDRNYMRFLEDSLKGPKAIMMGNPKEIYKDRLQLSERLKAINPDWVVES